MQESMMHISVICMYGGCMHDAFIYDAIRLLESLCSSVRPFVRPSPKSTASYIQHIYITESYVDLCNVHHTSVHHTYMIQEASYIHKSWKRCIVSCIIHSGSGTRIIDASYIQARFRIKAQDHLYVHNTHICIRIND